MRLESGPAAYDRNYHLIILVGCLALAAYFYYDYTIGYVKKNLAEARKQFMAHGWSDVDLATLKPTPTKPNFDALVESQPTELAQVHEKLGEPFKREDSGSGIPVEYFASTYGMVTVPTFKGRIDPARMKWTLWAKSKDEIRMQLYCAIFALVVALYFLYRTYRAATLRAVIDDDGMTYGGQRIPFDDMARLCDYSRKGWVDLYYQRGPQERRLRIDNQKIRRFDEIIDTLCEVKGFPDPRPAAAQPEAAESPEPTTTDDSDADRTE